MSLASCGWVLLKVNLTGCLELGATISCLVYMLACKTWLCCPYRLITENGLVNALKDFRCTNVVCIRNSIFFGALARGVMVSLCVMVEVGQGSWFSRSFRHLSRIPQLGFFERTKDSFFPDIAIYDLSFLFQGTKFKAVFILAEHGLLMVREAVLQIAKIQQPISRLFLGCKHPSLLYIVAQRAQYSHCSKSLETI